MYIDCSWVLCNLEIHFTLFLTEHLVRQFLRCTAKSSMSNVWGTSRRNTVHRRPSSVFDHLPKTLLIILKHVSCYKQVYLPRPNRPYGLNRTNGEEEADETTVVELIGIRKVLVLLLTANFPFKLYLWSRTSLKTSRAPKKATSKSPNRVSDWVAEDIFY